MADRTAEREQVLTVIKAVEKPVTSRELLEHPSIKPLELNAMSLGQILKYMVSRGALKRDGRGPAKATYAIPRTKGDRATRSAGPAYDSLVVIRMKRDGTLLSVVAPPNQAVLYEFAQD